MEFDPKEFKRKFPHLYKELGRTAEPDSPELDNEHHNSNSLNQYSPEVMSYLRRARTNEEGIEIIAYLREKREISGADADTLRKRIEQYGVRSFGDLRTWGHYERELRRKPLESLDAREEQEDQ